MPGVFPYYIQCINLFLLDVVILPVVEGGEGKEYRHLFVFFGVFLSMRVRGCKGGIDLCVYLGSVF